MICGIFNVVAKTFIGEGANISTATQYLFYIYKI